MPELLDKAEHIRELSIEDEMKESYLIYAMSVITDRALPDVRDGLKPSQRRILVAMNDLNLGPRSKHRKCAKIAGDTSGNYHPHGAEGVYPTLARMVQDFNFRYPLADGQGNFGSMDGDPPAAMRYTEARMTPVTMELMEDIEKDTVNLIPNYDETRKEPSVLPARFPNLLCNGAAGIAVGMATSIPPHNLCEVIDGLLRVIDEPDVHIDEILKIIKGPDFPTGGLICGRRGIVDGYKTGRGIIKVRGRAVIEEQKNGRKSIVFTEIPYQLNRDRVIERIADAVKAGKVQGISNVANESDKEGTRIVVELKRGEDETVVLNQLYKRTQLEDSFSIIMIALVDKRPITLNIKQMLELFRDHRIEVIRRRTAFLLDKAEREAHILEGLKIALDNIDEIITIIKKAKSPDDAKQKLVSVFPLTEIQAEAILRMQLQRLTGLEREKIDQTLAELMEKIANYRAVLKDENLVLDIIREDLHELKEKYGDDRRSEIVGEIQDFNIEDLIAEEEMVVTISHESYIKRLPLSSYRKQKRGGKGITGAGTKEGDFIEHLFTASTHDYILFFSDKGKCYWLKVYDIPQLSRQAAGRAVVNLLSVEKGENITSHIPVRNFDDRFLLMVTEQGVTKKTALKAYGRPMKTGIIAIALDKGDKLVGVRLTRGTDEIVIATQNGQAIHFAEGDLRSQGRATRGVRGIRLRKGDKVQGVAVVDPNATLLTVCENGYGKRTDFDAYRLQSRGGQGVINIKTSERNGNVVGMLDVRDTDEIVMMTLKGMIIRTTVEKIRNTGRNAQGVRVISLKEGDKLVAIARAMEGAANGEEASDADNEVEEADTGEKA